MGRRSKAATALALLLAASAPGAAHGAAPSIAVARPALAGGPPGATGAAGTVFFLRAPSGLVTAIGAAHNFDRDALGRAGSVAFRLGHSGTPVARSEAFLVPPGRAFTDVGGSLEEDFVAFVLEAPPQAPVLEPIGPEGIRTGDRVRILGVPATEPRDQDDVFGTVSGVAQTRLEIDLDVPADLRGWGGAPVISEASGRVAGIVEAFLPDPSRMKVGAAPLGRLLRELDDPLRDGDGEPFAIWAGPGARDREPTRAARPRAAPPAPPPAPQRSARELLGVPGRPTPELHLKVDTPEDGTLMGGQLQLGALVAGTARAFPGDFPAFDVMIVIDTSGSTQGASGADVNGNGVVGRDFGLFGNDAGDSILAAEVAAAQRLLASLDPSFARVGVVTFAGMPRQGGFGFSIGGRGVPPPAITEQPLTTEYGDVETALELILARGPGGLTHMTAGVDQAVLELLGLPGALSEKSPDARKVVFFLTDGSPTLPVESNYGLHPANVESVMRAANRGRKASVEIHTFAIGPEALDGPIATVEIADRTGGIFTPVRHPADIVPAIEMVNLARIESITVTNETTGVEAADLVVAPDGSYGALVPLAPGKNRIAVVARSTDGMEAREVRLVEFAPDAEIPDVPPQHLARRNQLLERRLLTLRNQGKAVDLAAVETTRRELQLEIERERTAARARADQQRKELRLEVEPSAPEPPP